MFARPVCTFNLQGEQKIGTPIGFILTILIYGCLTSYTISRFIFFVSASRPNISSFTLPSSRNGTEVVDLREFDFNIAFSVVNANNQE